MAVYERTILVVDDNEDDAGLIREAFQQAGFDNRIQNVKSPDAAIRYLKGEGDYADRAKFPFPRLILLDHKKAGSGWEVIEWVRKRGQLKALPVVVFSGSNDPSHRKQAEELGANAYEIKPQKFGEFVETVKRIGEFWLMGGGAR